MIQSEQILEYIDGQLDTESEQELFDALSRQSELRSVLRQFISIGQAVHADREAYTPPADVERTLMAGLGIAASELGYASTTSTLLARLGAAMGGKLWGIVDAFVLGSVLTAILLYAGGGVSISGGSGNSAMNSGAGSRQRTELVNGPNTNSAERTGSGSTMQSGADAGGPPVASATNSASGGDGRQTIPPTSNAGTSSSNASAMNAGASNPATFGATHSDANGTNSTTNRNNATIRNNTAVRSGRDGAGSAAARDVRRNRADARVDHAPRTSDGNGSTASGADEGAITSDRRSSTTSSGHDGVVDPAAATPTSTRMETVIVPATIASVRMRADGSRAEPAVSVRAKEAVISETLRERLNSSDPLNGLEEERTNGAVIGEARLQYGGAISPSKVRAGTASGHEAFAIGGYWQFAPTLALGLEGGQESYDQTLRRVQGDTLQIDQRPSYIWGGVGLRYYLPQVAIGDLHPFAQTTIGGTSAGPLVRLRMGGDLKMFGPLSANASAELSSLIYTFDGQRFTSARWGLTFGMAYSFNY